MKFGMFHGIKQKRKYVSISMKEIGCNLDSLPKGKKELHNVFGILVSRT